MGELEGSETLDENGMVLKSGRIGNSNEKSLGAARVYGSGRNSTEPPVCVSNSVAEKYRNEFDSERVRGFKEVENISEEVRVKGIENAPQSRVSDGVVSENGISLFVEVSGPQNGFVKGNEVVLGKNIESGRSSNSDVVEENRVYSYIKVENLFAEVLGKEEEATLCEEHKFLVGDLVWVLTKSNSWWPGLVIDPSHICNVGPKPDKDHNDSLLVKYFGNNPTVWCSPLQLKPFAENFEHLSSQGKSNVFLSAVEKIVDEFGRRIKAQMTCSCENRDIKDETFFFNKNLLSQFEPAKLLYLVKNLAWDETNTARLALVKIRSLLSAFYSSLGHHQLPMNQLHETTDDNKNSSKRGKTSKVKDVIADKESETISRDTYPVQLSEIRPERGFKSRERKRSKYLSYPYIDLNQSRINFPIVGEDPSNDVAVANNLAGSSVFPPKVKIIAKKLYTKRPQMPIYQPKALLMSGDLNTPSIDLLSKLQFAAVDCFFLKEGSGFDLVDRFIIGFRRWVFHDNYDYEMEHTKESVEKSSEFKFQEPFRDKPLTSDLNPVITPKQKRGKKNEVSTTISYAKSSNDFKIQDLVGDKPLTNNSNLISTPKPKKRKKNEISTTNSNAKSAPSYGVFEGNSNSGSFFLNFKAPGSIGPHNFSEPKKKKYKVSNIPELVQAEISTTVLPDLNANHAENGAFVNNVILMGNREGVNNEAIDNQSNNDGNKFKESSLVKSSWVMGLLAPGNNHKPEAKKSLRKEKTMKREAQPSTVLDLNGNANIEDKSPKKRKRRNKMISPRSYLNPCFTRVDMNGELTGTALVLTFAQGFPVPSKEALIATFCGFGPLNETETKGLSDNRSAQVVFKNGSEAVEALKGIEKSSPFGPVLIKCQLRHIGLKPYETKASKLKEVPDLEFIRKNLEMMTSTLEKGGDNLSAEMRVKLENEIKILRKKITMVGSTSSS